MPEYVLTIEGPRPATSYVNASDDQGAIVMAKASVQAATGRSLIRVSSGRRWP